MRDSQISSFLSTFSGFSRGLVSSSKPNIQVRVDEILDKNPENLSSVSKKAISGLIERIDKSGIFLPQGVISTLEVFCGKTRRVRPQVVEVNPLFQTGLFKDDNEQEAPAFQSEWLGTVFVLDDQGGSVISASSSGLVGTLRSESHGHEPLLISGKSVRRISCLEAERLQGFPDNYTLSSDSSRTSRMKALGNSMAVPVMEWIGNCVQISSKESAVDLLKSFLYERAESFSGNTNERKAA